MPSFVSVFFFVFVCSKLSNVKSTKHLNEVKDGQCPYILSTPTKCDFECSSDLSCEGSQKCCSNNCGTECMQPLNFTMCQHQRLVAQNHVEESTTNNAFIPECKEDGVFVDKQCDLNKTECWCVDFRGFEISQTRTFYANDLDCSQKSYSGNCPLYNCKRDCEYGFKLDKDGCRTCECVNPCVSIECHDEKESCRLLNVKSRGWPTPPVPLCLSPPDNPCRLGDPLKINNDLASCGVDEKCPSTHMCRSSVFSNRGFCCPTVVPAKCPTVKCSLACPHGFKIDNNGCFKCACYNPCSKVTCPPPTKCKVVQVQCFRAPCPPIAQCE